MAVLSLNKSFILILVFTFVQGEPPRLVQLLIKPREEYFIIRYVHI